MIGGAEGARPDPASRRTRLREYQEQLLERMQAAKGGSGAPTQQLGLQVGGTRYLLDLLEAGEIVSPVPLARVPLTLPWYLGLANVRGTLVGVVDLARYLGADGIRPPGQPAGAPPGASPGTSPSMRMVTFAPTLGFNCALLADRVYGLRQAASMRREGEVLRDADDNVWTPLSLAALVREERFLNVAQQADQRS
ncbi:chemotaxis protein CheW [Massilia sp. BSC265]|uniref:chemotaxis protein CheW n=1 Tax=Massilia sp. BSC265 TaxID=1549812 RepID=UPI0004E8DAC2|nr:chemotaxis protein CheW [Massilia sp. BSC265]KFI06278.1 type IV pili signal transduction protein [Massilia sp. BSC265]